MDRFWEMTVFTTVADKGGFSAAAKALQQSGPAITRTINLLEERLGARLLHRTTRTVRLTEAGERFLVDCRRILSDVREAESAATGLHSEPQGMVSVTASQTFGRLFVGPLLLDYMAQHPRVTVRTLFVDRVVDLLDEGMDVAVRISQLADSSQRALKVGQVRRVLCASPAYLAEHGIPDHPSALSDHRCIQFTSMSPRPAWRFTLKGGEEHTVSFAPQLITSTADLAISAAIRGQGIVCVLSYMVASDLRDGRLQCVLTDAEPPPIPIYLLHHEGERVSAKVRSLIDHLAVRLRGDPALH